MNHENNKPEFPYETDGCFRATAMRIDEEVANGRDVNELLKEKMEHPGQKYWCNPDVLKFYSTAVAQLYEEGTA